MHVLWVWVRLDPNLSSHPWPPNEGAVPPGPTLLEHSKGKCRRAALRLLLRGGKWSLELTFYFGHLAKIGQVARVTSEMRKVPSSFKEHVEA
jgi:hypothetical protein